MQCRPLFQPITVLRSASEEAPGLFWMLSDHVERKPSPESDWGSTFSHRPSLVCPPHPRRRTESTCQREVRPLEAGRSRQSGASPCTTLLTCPRITPRLREGPCSAPPQEVTWTQDYSINSCSIQQRLKQVIWKIESKSPHTWANMQGAFKDTQKNWIIEFEAGSFVSPFRHWSYKKQLNVNGEPVLKYR